MQAQQLVMWPLLPAERQARRKSSGVFSSGFSVTDDLFSFTLRAPEVAPGGVEAEERRAARVREIEARKAVKV